MDPLNTKVFIVRVEKDRDNKEKIYVLHCVHPNNVSKFRKVILKYTTVNNNEIKTDSSVILEYMKKQEYFTDKRTREFYTDCARDILEIFLDIQKKFGGELKHVIAREENGKLAEKNTDEYDRDLSVESSESSRASEYSDYDPYHNFIASEDSDYESEDSGSDNSVESEDSESEDSKSHNSAEGDNSISYSFRKSNNSKKLDRLKKFKETNNSENAKDSETSGSNTNKSLNTVDELENIGTDNVIPPDLRASEILEFAENSERGANSDNANISVAQRSSSSFGDNMDEDSGINANDYMDVDSGRIMPYKKRRPKVSKSDNSAKKTKDGKTSKKRKRYIIWEDDLIKLLEKATKKAKFNADVNNTNQNN